MYLALTLIDNLEMFQAYGNITHLHVDYGTFFKLVRGVVELKV